jgi:hypothetical protein
MYFEQFLWSFRNVADKMQNIQIFKIYPRKCLNQELVWLQFGLSASTAYIPSTVTGCQSFALECLGKILPLQHFNGWAQ